MRCVYTSNGNRCSADAIGSTSYCLSHAAQTTRVITFRTFDTDYEPSGGPAEEERRDSNDTADEE
jgi:hypothetical protein